MAKYVVVEGNIGAGKTTLIELLAKRTGWRVLEEPVESNPYLDLFYANKKRFAFLMQLNMLRMRHCMEMEAAHSSRPTYLDRCKVGDRVLAMVNYRLGNMTKDEWNVYESFFDLFSQLRPPHLMLFLETPANEALVRVQARGRECERGLELAYLREIQVAYHELLADIERGTHCWSRGMVVWHWAWSAGDDRCPEKVAVLAEAVRREVGR